MNTQKTQPSTVYPHSPEVVKLNPFTGGTGALAGVTLRYGPVFIRAYVRQTHDGKLFLSMPGRKNEKGDWWDSAFFADRTLSDQFEALAVSEYQAQVGLVPEQLVVAA